MSAAPRPTPRAERTRAAILAAAEERFASHGFDAARLEDVAERVGIRRASIVYYFRDKRALYDAVLDDVFGDLFARVREALLTSAPLADRIDAAVSAWVVCSMERPGLPRLLLREVADAATRGPATLRRHTEPFFELVRSVLADTEGDPMRGRGLDPALMASAVAGTSLFHLAAMPALVPELTPDPAALRSELVAIVRRILAPEPAEARA